MVLSRQVTSRTQSQSPYTPARRRQTDPLRSHRSLPDRAGQRRCQRGTESTWYRPTMARVDRGCTRRTGSRRWPPKRYRRCSCHTPSDWSGPGRCPWGRAGSQLKIWFTMVLVQTERASMALVGDLRLHLSGCTFWDLRKISNSDHAQPPHPVCVRPSRLTRSVASHSGGSVSVRSPPGGQDS